MTWNLKVELNRIEIFLPSDNVDAIVDQATALDFFAIETGKKLSCLYWVYWLTWTIDHRPSYSLNY